MVFTMHTMNRGLALQKQRRKNIVKILFCFILLSICLSYAILLNQILTSSSSSSSSSNNNTINTIDDEKEDAAATAIATDKKTTNKRQENRFLLYITTHMSEHHMTFLPQCWPLAVQNSPKLLQKADIMIFSTNNNNINMTKQEINAFHTAFPNNNKVIIHDYGSSTAFDKSYEAGAKLPMMEAFKHHWFDPYDWVLRVNLDVIIRNDTWILVTMENDEVDGIFTDCFGRNPNCFQNCTSHIIHSDFFAFRPRAIPRNTPVTNGLGWSANERSAEIVTTTMFREYIVKYGRDRWLPDSVPHKQATCRLSGKSFKNPVTHYHEETGKNENSTQLCIEYFLKYGKVTGHKSSSGNSEMISNQGSNNNNDHLINQHQTLVVLDENI